MISTILAGLLIGLATVCAKRSAATRRVLITGAGSGLAATWLWLALVLIAPPIPATVGWALTVTGAAAITAVLANSGRSGTTPGGLLAGLLGHGHRDGVDLRRGDRGWRSGARTASSRTSLPTRCPATASAESRIEIVDPYVLIFVLSAMAATALGLAAVVTRRRNP